MQNIVTFRKTHPIVLKITYVFTAMRSRIKKLAFSLFKIKPFSHCINYTYSCLLLHRVSCRFTNHHTTNKCTNCMSFILNHFFKTLFTAPIRFDTISLIIIREHIQFLVKITWACMLFLVQGGKLTCLPARETTYRICCHNNIITKKFIFLTRDFSQELYVLPDDDKRYAIETCRSSESVLGK